MPFCKLGLRPAIVTALQETGYSQPTPIQAAAIPIILSGRDLIGIAQTGTGKTAAFVLPILSRLAPQENVPPPPPPRHPGTRALIIAPTRELVVQIEENARIYAAHLPLRIATVFGGVGERPQIEALRTGADLVIATPGRLLDLMQRGYGSFGKLEFLVFDEADRMLDMGFIPAIRRIAKALPKKRRTLLFSATFPTEIEKLSQEFLIEPEKVQIGRRSNPAETVRQWIYEVPHHLKSPLLLHLMKEEALDKVVVFTRTKYGADRVARLLERNGIKAATLHSNRSQNQRLRALNDFRAGAARVLVATDIAARGMDVDGISHVVNYDFPMHSEDYVHRIGRTGRAQAAGDAISFVSTDDRGPLRQLERFIGKSLARRKADGFDYTVAAPPPRPDSGPRGGRNQRNPSGGGGGGGEGRSGRSESVAGRNFPSGGRRNGRRFAPAKAGTWLPG
ncbi:MAG TPA: DEAD/DEAH box helicase [Chthoniobacteraceae bacterium]|nr:DEAD/DEAH box helicase [Chthoniobacteraceae bacterium]